MIVATHDLTFAAETAYRAAAFFNATLTSPADTFRFFSGNRFYTTQAVRLTRDLTRVCLTADEAVAALRKAEGGTP